MTVVAEVQRAVISHVPRRVIDEMSRLRSSGRRRRATRRLAPILADVCPDAIDSELLVAFPDSAVLRIDRPSSSSILKVSFTPDGSQRLAQESVALDELGRLDELRSWREHVAAVEEQGSHSSGMWFIQSRLAGTPMSKIERPVIALASAAAALAPVHSATGRTVPVDEALTKRLVDRPFATIVGARPGLAAGLQELAPSIGRRLRQHHHLVLARLHGDFAPSNVLWDTATDKVTGIVDWTFDEQLEPPEIDLVHFAISALAHEHDDEYGTMVTRILRGDLPPEQRSMVADCVSLGPNQLDERLAVQLTWLQHVSIGLGKGDDLRSNPVWLHHNIDQVVASLD